LKYQNDDYFEFLENRHNAIQNGTTIVEEYNNNVDEWLYWNAPSALLILKFGMVLAEDW
jgi:hypothetical protein